MNEGVNETDSCCCYMKCKFYALGEFGSIYVSWFIDLCDASVFEPILYYVVLESFIFVKLVKK